MASNATDKASSKASATKASTIIYRYVVLAIAACCIAYIAYWAYNIRLVAILEYGKVIHEFDPYFNYRATEVRWVAFRADRNNDKEKSIERQSVRRWSRVNAFHSHSCLPFFDPWTDTEDSIVYCNFSLTVFQYSWTKIYEFCVSIKA